MPEIRAFQPQDLPQLTQLINMHISLLIPTWSLPSDLILSRLETNPDEPVIDPWVVERKTLCGFVGENLVAAAHLLRYGESELMNKSYHRRGDFAWFVFDPEFEAEAKTFLEACHEQMKAWEVKSLSTWDSGLYIPCAVGISDNWPHIGKLFYEAGYRPKPERAEAVYTGDLHALYTLPRKNSSFLIHRRRMDGLIRQQISLGTDKIAYCEITTNIWRNKPALAEWVELAEIWVRDDYHRQGIGRFLLQEVAPYLFMLNAKSIVFSVAINDERAGAGAFYQSFGWKAASRSQDAWIYEGKL